MSEGKVCVGESTSPGAPPCGTARSSTGKTGTPVSRSRTKTKPCLVAWTTTSRGRPAIGQRCQRRLRRDVVVPDVVLDDLEGPGERAVSRVQRDHRVGVLVRTGTQTAVEVRAGTRRRQEDQAALRVDRHRRPDVRRRPSLCRRCGTSGSQFQRSAPLRASNARTRPEGAETRPLSLIDEPTTTTSPSTTGADETWNSPGQTSRPVSISTSPSLPKPTQVSAGACVEGDQARVGRRAEDAQRAGRVDGRRGITPLGDAAAVEEIRRAPIDRDFRVVAPGLGTRRRVESDDLVERRAQDELVVDEDGRRLKLHAAHQCGRPA